MVSLLKLPARGFYAGNFTMLLPHLVLIAVLPAVEPSVQADVIIKGATLYEGTGQPGQIGDVAIGGERIAGVGRVTVTGKPRVIDGTGLIVAPGFIDLHTHSDASLSRPETKANLCYLMQGATTVVTGNCGAGPTDVAAYYHKLESQGVGSNVAHQVPHNAVRQQVVGNFNRPPTADELKKMEDLVERGMRDGAWGLSTGLIYNPGTYAKTDELIALARVAARYHGFYASHIRNESAGLLAAVDEALTIGREAHLPVHISHLKASGQKFWGTVADAVTLIERARANGQTVTADQYPYTASSTSLAATLIPAQFREGAAKDLQARLASPEQGPRLRRGIADRIAEHQEGKTLRIASYSAHTSWQGKDLATVAAQENKSVLDLVLDIERHGGAGVVSFCMSEEDVRLVMKQPFVATASDGWSQVPANSVPHPRSYGCFPRKIGRYAIDEKVISLEHALRSASGLPADILRLPGRGYLKAGYVADVVVLDPRTFRDRATFDKPHQYATGVRYLFVNGKLAIDAGRYTGALAGKALRHKGGIEN
jgi:N-acyl-D-aspartate/D-glutamate deacylase